MASSIVASAAQQLGALVVGQGEYLYEVSDKIERLQRDLQWMQCFLEDADNRQHKEKVVAIWVAEIRDFAYEAEEIVEKYLCRVSHHRKEGKWNTIKWFSCVLCDAQALYEVGSDIDCLRTRISELTSRMQMFGIRMISQSESLAYNNAVREQRRTYAHIEEDGVVGLEEDIKKVVDELVNSTSESKVVGLWGMGGLGKTTLARRIFQNDDVRKYFKNNCVWVYISKQFDRKDIYREILTGLKNIDKKIKELPDGDLAEEICKILKEKECLVILDDLWRHVDWDTLNPAFQGIKSSCSKILITTRNNSLVKHAEKDGYIHALRCLSEEESWKLLQRTLFPGNETTGESSTLEVNKVDQKNLQGGLPKFIKIEGSRQPPREPMLKVGPDVEDVKAKKEKLGRKMLEHCNGLPLAIKALGGLLSTKRTVAEWENVQRNIASYLMSDTVEGSDNIELSGVLELSYYDLPFYLKPCFLYLGIFPEDYQISTQRLYHLWEAEGLVTASAYGGDEILGVRLDDIAESFLNQLVNRSMVQVDERWSSGRIKSCRVHDMMRDLCLKKSKEVNFVNVLVQEDSEGPSNQIANRKLRRCALYLRGHASAVDTTLNKSPCIRSLVVFPQGDDDGKKILSGGTRKALSLVRVLDVEGTDIEGSRPVKFGNFIHLRYLSINGTLTCNSPSGIWECKYLETLDLRTSVTFELSNKFWKLERLRHLYLPRGIKLMGSKQLILKTNQLQQMETFKNFNVEFCNTEDLKKMTNMRVFTMDAWSVLDVGSLKCLLESPMINAKRLVKPLCLQIKADVINEDPTMLTTRGSDLFIDGIRIQGRIDVELDDSVQIFPNSLTSVYLSSCEIGEQGIRMLEKLPLLKKLDLIFDGIKVSKMSFSKGGFTQLVQLFLGWLDMLEEMEVEERALPNLRYLNITYCRNLKRIPEGLPSSIQIDCNPCVEGIVFYKTCPFFSQK